MFTSQKFLQVKETALDISICTDYLSAAARISVASQEQRCRVAPSPLVSACLVLKSCSVFTFRKVYWLPGVQLNRNSMAIRRDLR